MSINGKIIEDVYKNDSIISRGIDIITKYTKIINLELILKDCIL